MTSHKLFPTATLVVPEGEANDYARFGMEIVIVPDAIQGISSLRNWILKRFTDDAIVMLDDDISACVCMVSLRCRRLSPDETRRC